MSYLKNIKLLITSLCITQIFLILPSSQFKQSLEEELDEVVLFQQQDAMPEMSLKEVKDYFIEATSFKHHKNSKFLPELAQDVIKSSDKNSQKVAKQILDVSATFIQLKAMMNIPDEVDIMFLNLSNINPSGGAAYNSTDRVILLSEIFWGQSPSAKLFTLIHELTHCQQHVRMGGLNYLRAKTFDIEAEADRNAAQAIECPICMQIIQDNCPSDSTKRAQEGYLTKEELDIIKLSKKMLQICDAHKTNSPENQQLKKLLPPAPVKGIYNKITNSWSYVENGFFRVVSWWNKTTISVERMEIDFSIGTMQERLSTVAFQAKA